MADAAGLDQPPAGRVRPRIILFTGKGGVGKTTSAAGTATLAARGGKRTLVLSTDAAHSLGDAFGAEIGPEPTPVETNLWVQQVDVQARFVQSWADVQGYLKTVLDAVGIDPITAEELTVIPGAEEVLALLELRAHALGDAWDVIVVDCAPTAETLRLLALPEALSWYMDRLFGVQRRVVKALRPVLTKAAGVPMPEDNVFDAVQRLHDELAEVQQLLSGPDSSVRLVLTPERVVLAEARRSLTTLSLYGYRVDGVIANRIFPAATDEWVSRWVSAQAEVMGEVRASFDGMPIWTSGYQDSEPVGCDALAALSASVYGDSAPWEVHHVEAPLDVIRTETGAILSIKLPFASKDDVDLARHGEDLVITVGSYRRILSLPAALARLDVAGAKVDENGLRVRFKAREVSEHDR